MGQYDQGKATNPSAPASGEYGSITPTAHTPRVVAVRGQLALQFTERGFDEARLLDHFQTAQARHVQIDDRDIRRLGFDHRQDIVAAAAYHGVRACATIKGVCAVPTVEQVRRAVTGERIIRPVAGAVECG